MWNKLTNIADNLGATLAPFQGWLLPLLLTLTALVLVYIFWQIRRAYSSDEKNTDTKENNAANRILKPLNIFHWMRLFILEIAFLFKSRKKNYNSPWYLLLAATSNSGKSQLTKALKNEKKPYLSSRESSFNADSSHWHFFNPGTLIDIDEALFTSNNIDSDINNDINNNKKRWTRLIEKIQDYRPERPIDGIIINLSASQLKNQPSDFHQHLDHLRESLWQLQLQYSFALPVYLIINHCESIEGFNAFCTAIPKTQQQQIIGWSNSARIDESINLSEANNGLMEVQETLKGVILAIAASEIELTGEETDELMQFPYNLSELQKAIIDSLGQLFKQTDPNSSFFIRGIYFSGYSKKHEKLSFSEEIFTEKVFPERNLAYPTNHGSSSLNRRLRRFKYVSALTLLILFIVAGFEYRSLNNQVENIEKVLDKMNTIEAMAPADGNMVYPLLREMANMDAGELTRWSMPLSKFMKVDKTITQFLSDKKFTKVIFPRIEKKLKQLGDDFLKSDKNINITSHTPSQPFKNWLARLQKINFYFNDFEELARVNYGHKNGQILTKFTNLTEHLYQQKLPDKFTQHSDLYSKALAQSCYPKTKDDCHSLNIDFHNYKIALLSDINWQLLAFAEKTQKSLISNSAYSGELFSILEQINLSPTQTSLSNIQRSLESFSHWYDQQQKDWMGSEDPCQSVQSYLIDIKGSLEKNNIHQLTNISKAITLFDKEQCSKPAIENLSNTQYPIFASLIANSSYGEEKKFKPEVVAFRETIPELQKLSFYTIIKETNPSYIGENYFWDYKQLKNATKFYSDYEIFLDKQYRDQNEHQAKENSQRSPIAQDIAKNLLHYAMKTTLLNARLDKNKAKSTLPGLSPLKRAVSPEQELLAQKIRQFKPAMQTLAELPGLFNQLGFVETADEVNTLTRNYSIGLLRSADTLAKNSKLYAVKKRLLWMQPNMLSALFGISKPELLKGYLFSQKETSKNITLNYAAPALQFLINADYPFQSRLNSDDQLLFSRWYETSVQVNKSEQPDPNNTLQKLEDFFANQLSQLNQSNCFGQSIAQEGLTGVDLFSVAQREIINNAENYCRKYNIDIIRSEYASLAKEFNKNLSGKFPFTHKNNLSATERNYRNEAEYSSVQRFFQNYQTKYQGISDRIVLLAKKDSRYNETKEFLNQLQKSADFFSTNLTISDQFNNTAISTKAEFRTKVFGSKKNPQIIHWQLSSAGESVSSPGPSNFMNWFFEKDINLKLRWSNTAKTIPAEQQGPPSQVHIDESEKTATFEYTGNWALLRFILNHRSNIKDPLLPVNSQENVLSFSIDQVSSTNNSAAARSQLFMRLALYGTNPDTGTKELLSVPSQFPVSAPKISASSKRITQR